jgi:hypothetical protein
VVSQVANTLLAGFALQASCKLLLLLLLLLLFLERARLSRGSSDPTHFRNAKVTAAAADAAADAADVLAAVGWNQCPMRSKKKVQHMRTD